MNTIFDAETVLTAESIHFVITPALYDWVRKQSGTSYLDGNLDSIVHTVRNTLDADATDYVELSALQGADRVSVKIFLHNGNVCQQEWTLQFRGEIMLLDPR